MKKKKIWELQRTDILSYRNTKKIPFVLVVDNVRSLNNIGSLFRTSDALLVEKIVLCGISATPPSAEIHKTALGAEDSVEWQYFTDTRDAVQSLKSQGYIVVALEQVKGSVELQDFEPSAQSKYAIIVGNEVDGVNQEVVDMCDSCIEIPQYGTKHSLNVSVSAALAIWHFFNILKQNIHG